MHGTWNFIYCAALFIPQFRSFELRFCGKVINNYDPTCCRKLFECLQSGETKFNSDWTDEEMASPNRNKTKVDLYNFKQLQ